MYILVSHGAFNKDNGKLNYVFRMANLSSKFYNYVTVLNMT